MKKFACVAEMRLSGLVCIFVRKSKAIGELVFDLKRKETLPKRRERKDG
jgi:hypothetical protein